MPRWTPETRLKQAAAIRRWMPWTLATGPVTAEGKARSSRNAWKGGVRARVVNWHQGLKQIALVTKELISSFRQKRAFRTPPKTAPARPTPSPVWGCLDGAWEEDDELVAIDQMSSAELQAAFHRMRAVLPGRDNMKFHANLLT